MFSNTIVIITIITTIIIAFVIVVWHDHNQKMNIAISILNNVITIISVFFLNLPLF